MLIPIPISRETIICEDDLRYSCDVDGELNEKTRRRCCRERKQQKK